MNAALNEQPFVKVDNPGEWPEYCFTPKFEGKGKQSKYVHHTLSTGAAPVATKGRSEKRRVEDWQFTYTGWKADAGIPLARHGANISYLFLEESHISLDGEHLTKLGLTAVKVKYAVGLPDAIFFHQLLLHICDTSRSGGKSDGRMNYYDDVQMFSALYQISNKIGPAYGHKLPLPTVEEFVKFDGVVVRDAVYGRGEGAIYRSWQDSACGDALIKGNCSY